jgi:hypothetical protein
MMFLDNIGIFFGCVSMALGSALVYSGTTSPDADQSGWVIGGATLFSLGSITLMLIVRSKLAWRQSLRLDRQR